MGEVFNRSININYSLSDFDENPKEKEAITIAKKKALQMKFSINKITGIGSGSKGRTTVYKTDQVARKVICCQTQKYTGKDLKKEEEIFLQKVKDDLSFRKSIVNEIQCWMKLNPKNNIIPMYGFEIFSWICPEYNRIGADCEVEMPLAECITNSINKYVLRKQKANFEEKSEDEGVILQIGIDLCTALIAVHKENIIHRDIKPDNIFLLNEHFCLGDFGIALDQNNPQYLSADSSMNQVGTYAYWAPEQADGKIADQRTDIYSLGLVLYELADTAPMSSHYKDRIYEHILPELSAHISKGLKSILRNACAYSPDHRYQTAEEFKDDLCRLKDNPKYIPESTKSRFEQKLDQTKMSRVLEMGRISNGKLSENSRFHKFGINNQRSFEKYLCPETAWKAGKFWYDESCKSGSRFAGLDIDKWIMPLTSPKPHITDFPVNITTNPECNSKPIPLFKIIEHPENLHNMYLIGEGGIGKTTALHFIMKDAYKDKVFTSTQNKTLVIPLFVELSKAPASYCNAYKNNQSTFIQRYLFTLISSLSENHLIFENAYEMTTAMEMEADSIIKNIRYLLDNKNQTVKYLLLLDGLNEVSRRELIDDYNNQIDTPSDLIIDEIQELLKYSNVSAIITSRADETLGVLDNEFNRLYLTGVSEQDIERYLERYEIDYTTIKENNRLMETLKIPLFLKLYSQLYSVSGVSTPGEILYAFFSERSVEYTARKRITEIGKDRRSSGNAHSASLSDERIQWFILDFVLPKLGWYMEKNNLYTVELETIYEIMNTVLMGTSETDICGKYGIEMFSDYHNGNDGSINVKTYADQLLTLNSTNKNYVQELVDFCVYSLGILYVNNQNYGFVHQHLRDFFASVKIVTDMKLASYIFNTKKDIELGHRCLTSLTSELLSEEIMRFTGEILCEYQNVPIYTDGQWKSNMVKNENIALSQNNRFLITNTLELFRYYFPSEKAINYGVWNILKIMYTARKTLAATDLRNLDLRGCSLNNIELYDADLSGALIHHETLFPNGHTGSITKAVVSPSGKYVFTCGHDGNLKLWHLKTGKCIRDIKKYDYPINSISISQDYIAVSTSSYVEILDINTYEVKQKYKAYYGVFSPNGKYLLLLFHFKKARLLTVINEKFSLIGKLPYAPRCTYSNGIAKFGNYIFSPDSSYLTFKSFSSSRAHTELWKTDTCSFINTLMEEDCSNNISFSPDGKYILSINYLCQMKLFAVDKTTEKVQLIHNIEFKHILNYENLTITSMQFVANGKYVLIGDAYGNLFLCDFDTLLTSPKDIDNHCCLLSGHHDSINSIYEYVYNNIHYAITSSSDCKVMIWNLQTHKCISSLHKGNVSSTLSACYVLGGKYVVISGNSRELLLFDSSTGKYIDRICTNNDYTWKVSYHEKTQQIAVALDNGVIALYRYFNQKFTHQKTIKVMDEYIGELKFSPKGDKLLAISYISNIVCVYDILTEKIVTLNNMVNQFHDSATFTSQQNIITTNLNSANAIGVHTASKNEKQSLENYSFRCNGAFSYPDGETVLVSLQNADSIGYFDSNTGSFKGIDHAYYEPYRKNVLHRIYKESENIPWEHSMKQVDAIAYSQNGTYLFITRNGGRVELWNNFTCKCLAILKAFDADAKNLAISADGDYIAFSTCGPNIKIYRMCDIQMRRSDIIQWKCKYNIRGNWRFPVNNFSNKLYRLFYKSQEGHTDSITGIEFRADKQQLLTIAYDQFVKIWDLSDTTEEQYQNSPRCLHSIEFIPGLKVNGAYIRNLHKNSILTDKEINLLKTYGAIL